MVSVLQKELEYKVEKLKYERFRSCSRGSESNPNFQLVNKPSWISPHEVLRSQTIREGCLLVGRGLFEGGEGGGGGFNRGFTVHLNGYT